MSVVAPLASQPAYYKCAGQLAVETQPPPISHVLHQLEVAKWTDRIDRDVAVALESSTRFQDVWLQSNRGEPQQVSTFRNGNEDVLLARWKVQPGHPQIKSITMWDGALYHLVLYEVDPAVIESDESLRAFLLTVVNPQRAFASGPSAQELSDGFAFHRLPNEEQPADGLFIWQPDHHQIGGLDQMIFTFYRMGDKLLMVFEFGKRAKNESWPQSIYLGDRFPPLAKRVLDWKKERLLQEVSQPETTEMCSEASAAGTFRESIRDARDEVLIAELVRRGLDDQEFQTVIDSVNGESLLPALRNANELDRFHDSIKRRIRRYEGRRDVNTVLKGRGLENDKFSRLADLIRYLDLAGIRGFATLMLELVEAGHEPEWALEYIDHHPDSSNGQSFIQRLKDSRVPPGLEKKKAEAIAKLEWFMRDSK